jgi:hypothetical protein
MSDRMFIINGTAIKANGTIASPLLPPTSRYYGLETVEFTSPGRKTVSYLRRRFLPRLDRFDLLQYHVVSEGERLDNIAVRYLGDPEQFWRICDANNTLSPFELTLKTGRKIRITLPEGIRGTRYA